MDENITDRGITPDSDAKPKAGAATPQVGALCWRPNSDGIEVLLITSRDTGRWVIPKGGLIEGLDAANSARQEAWEEAGVEGVLYADEALGWFHYDKMIARRTAARRCRVEVFSLQVERLAEDFPERDERRREWFDPGHAATQVQEAALSHMLETLARAPQILTEGTDRTGAQRG